MAAFVKTAIPNRYIGASADTKPTGVGVGSMCYEHNTGKTFITYDGTNWTQYAPTTYLSDVVPLADDSEYLGTAALGWKGLYLPDTLIVDDTGVVKIRSVANDADLSLTALNLTLSGTTTALTFSGAATIVAGAGLTMPAFTLGGAVSGGAQTISNANVTVGASRTLDVSAGTLTLAADQISGDKVEGGTIAAITITALTAGSITASGTATFNGNVVMGTSAIDADSGVVTLFDMAVTAAVEDTEQSYAFNLDGVPFLTIYGLTDATGAATDNRAVKLGTYLQLVSTDTDSATAGQVWYDTSENVIKYHNGTGVKTIAVVP